MREMRSVSRLGSNSMHKFVVGSIAILLMVSCSRPEQSSTPTVNAPVYTASATPAVIEQNKDDADGIGKSKQVEIRGEKSKGNIGSWQAIALKGKRLELIHSSIIQIFDFVEDEHVIATLGIKDDAVAGPILMWEIRDDLLSITSETRSSPIILLRNPVVEGNPASVFGQTLSAHDLNGGIVRYKLSSIPAN